MINDFKFSSSKNLRFNLEFNSNVDFEFEISKDIKVDELSEEDKIRLVEKNRFDRNNSTIDFKKGGDNFNTKKSEYSVNELVNFKKF